MLKIKILTFLIFVSSFIHATDLKPWYGKEYETEIRSSVLYQNYQTVASPHRTCFQRDANDAFINLSAAYPFKRYCGEFEATVACTRHQNCRWDSFRFTGRIQALDDREGDCISLVGGITFIQPFSRALHDISSFHHGHIEGLFTLSVGKKYGLTRFEDYSYRWWNVFGIGASDVGMPWLLEQFAFEYILRDLHHFRCFTEILWGTGRESIVDCCFEGYGFIKHRSVDVGFRYGYDFCGWGTLSLQYARRLYAYNFPKNANLVLIEFYFPFGTQFNCSY
jgi:hypothetical protein